MMMDDQVEVLSSDLISARTLFVGDLSFFCNEDDIRALFSAYGEVLNVEIKRGKATGDSLMHGFVEMESEFIAETAMNTLAHTKFMGRKLRVFWGNGRNSNNNSMRERENWIQLHVSFVSRQVRQSYSRHPCPSASNHFVKTNHSWKSKLQKKFLILSFLALAMLQM